MFNATGKTTEVKNDTSNTSYTVSGDDFTTTALSVRYEYILNFNKSKERKLVPSLGFGANLYFNENTYEPRISSSFPSSQDYLGAKVFVIPRITYYLKSKLFFDINFPLCFFDTYYLSEKENNPAIQPSERKTSSYNFQLFPTVFSTRLGIGLKL
jgi:hypothetical protein